MMTGFGKVGEFTAEEIILMHDLYEIAKKAKNDCAIVFRKYKNFGIGEEKIEVWHDFHQNNFEYLTRDGVWQARYMHQEYDVKISVESLYDLYKKAYLVNSGYVGMSQHLTEFERECLEAELICRYLSYFIERAAK